MEHYNGFFLAALFAALIWLVVLIFSLQSLYKRSDMILPAKIFWAFVIFSAPVVGLIFYFFLTSKRRNAV